MKRILPAVILILCAVLAARFLEPADPPPAAATSVRSTAEQQGDASENLLADAWASRRSNVQVEGSGTVTRVLSDDNDGSRHQRFILELSSGQTLLVAHNIDLAPRIQDLAQGDTVRFFGEYEWNDRGGVIHWTHHDPDGRHVGGWLEHDGYRYE
jgi:hypothetical protein